MTITASTFGNLLVELDSSKLRLFARPYVVGNVVERKRRVTAKIGPAVRENPPGFLLAHPLPYNVQRFSMAVALSGPPGPPGIYDVWAQALDGFANAGDARTVPLSQRTGFTPANPEQIFWPDESGNDRALARLRKKLVGRLVYGYGGMAFSCRPDWTKFYSASTPVRVRSIERERGVILWLATGNAALAPLVMGRGFIAFDPLSLVVEDLLRRDIRR